MRKVVKGKETYYGLTSAELLDLAKKAHGAVLEPFLASGMLRATHFVSAEGRSRFTDEGIDGVERTVGRKRFLADYPKATWWLDKRGLPSGVEVRA